MTWAEEKDQRMRVGLSQQAEGTWAKLSPSLSSEGLAVAEEGESSLHHCLSGQQLLSCWGWSWH